MRINTLLTNWSHKKILAGATAVSALALSSIWLTSPASANHSWSTVHWARTTALSIRVADNVGAAWDPYLGAAATDWTAAQQIDTPVIAGTANPATCPATYGRIEACSAAYGGTGWLGIANIWTSGGHIVQATVQLNDSYFAMARYNTPAWRRTVMCQEIGHTLGLDHQDVNQSNLNLGSCMDYTNDPTGTKGTNGTLNNERPNQHDYDQLNIIYAHADSSQLLSTKPSSATAAATAGERARPSQSRAGLTPGEWGRATAFTKGGRPRVFVKDLGGGEQLTTFVTWAEPEAPHGEGEHVH